MIKDLDKFTYFDFMFFIIEINFLFNMKLHLFTSIIIVQLMRVAPESRLNLLVIGHSLFINH